MDRPTASAPASEWARWRRASKGDHLKSVFTEFVQGRASEEELKAAGEALDDEEFLQQVVAEQEAFEAGRAVGRLNRVVEVGPDLQHSIGSSRQSFDPNLASASSSVSPSRSGTTASAGSPKRVSTITV